MKEGEIVIAILAQADGKRKSRPALLLRELPPYGDFLACWLSTQKHQAVPGFDEIIDRCDSDFAASGLDQASVFRLAFLSVVPRDKVVGSIGKITPERHARLLRSLCRHLVAKL